MNIKRANKIHNSKYDYSLVKYINAKTKVKIICPIHGIFEQKPTHHLAGNGCQKCGAEKSNSGISLDTIEFIKRSSKIHSNKYDYSLVEYQSYYTKIIIICPIHGAFEQNPSDHLRGCGCKKCGIIKNSNNRKGRKPTIDKRPFEIKAHEKHNNKYDYSLANYKNNYTKVIIICKEHGEFKQTPHMHLRGNGCPKCVHPKLITSTKQCIKLARNTHGNKYDYSKTEFKSNKNKITIICPRHGEFRQPAIKHVNGAGCMKCFYIKKDTEKFIDDAKLVHGDKYDYSKTNYVHSKKKIVIVCHEHGEFKQQPNGHLNGQGCPQCVTVISRGHQELIDYIEKIGFKCVINDRTLISPYELDVLIENTNIAVEFNGVRWHSFNKIESKNERMRHYKKQDLCIANNLTLIQIFENEWMFKKDVIKSILYSKLKLNKIILAKKCSIVELSNDQYTKFCNKNHLHGSVPANIKLGLVFNGTIICALGVNKNVRYDYEIIRFVDIIGNDIIGGFSKLFDYFVKCYNPLSVMAYADRRYSNGDLYKNEGFEQTDVIDPNYYWVKGCIVYNKQKFQKQKLSKILRNYDELLSGPHNLFNNGYRRLWDAGKWKFVWIFSHNNQFN